MAEGDTTNQPSGVVIGTPVQNTVVPTTPIADTNTQAVQPVDPAIPVTPVEPVVTTPMPVPVNNASEPVSMPAQAQPIIETPVDSANQSPQTEIMSMPVEQVQQVAETPLVSAAPTEQPVAESTALPEVMTPVPTPPTHSTALSVGNAMEGDLDPMEVPQDPTEIKDEVQQTVDTLPAQNVEMQPAAISAVAPVSMEPTLITPVETAQPTQPEIIAPSISPEPMTTPMEQPVPVQPAGDATPVQTQPIQEPASTPISTNDVVHGKPIVNDQGFLVGEEGASQKKNLN